MQKILNGELIDMSAEEIAAFEAERNPPPTQADYVDAITKHIEATAKSRGYDGALSLSAYVSSTNPAWKAEAETFVAWRDGVWAFAYTQLAAVQGGQRAQPTPAELLAEIPKIAWPT